MLQTNEYRASRYIAWVLRTADFRNIMRRQKLVYTRKAQLLVAIAWVIATALIGLLAFALYTAASGEGQWWIIAAGIVIVSPFVLALGLTLPLVIGYVLIQKPREKVIIARAREVLNNHPAKRIAVLGSYGKTTAKEMLKTVLAEGVNVAATPGNMNTAIGISRFVMKLRGNEDVLLFELGEEKPGDIRRLSRIVRPDLAIITGINEAHLQSFKTLERTVETIYEITDFVEPSELYQNTDNTIIAKSRNEGISYGLHGVGEAKVTHATTSLDGTDFTVAFGDEKLAIHTALLGLHTVGVSAAVAAIAKQLGLKKDAIEEGFRNVQPFEHRMQLKPLHGAWIIDDTYNGNSDGIKAGLELLATLDAKRRVYVTPGLVETGSETEKVHVQIGVQAAKMDVVVLMQNSVTEYIQAGLKKGKFKGELLIVDDPLSFYTNLDQIVAAGDVVLMQNDWTDNYA